VSPEKRRGGPVLFAGLGGFALGAATVLFVVWVYGVGPGGAALSPGGMTQSGAGQASAQRQSHSPAPGGPQTASPPDAAGGTGETPSGSVPDVMPAPGLSPGTSPPGNPGPSPGTGAAQAPPAERPPVTEPGSDGRQERPPPLTGKSPEIADLRQRRLLLPVQGTRREQLVDSFADGRAGHRHEAIDIMAPRNTPVMAVEDGRLTKLFWSERGGNTIYQFDPGATYAYYYAHLDRYADGLHEGDALHRGQVIGYVGSSGNAAADAPHLHFAIFLLTPEKHWWQGTPIDPYDVLKQP
jgi:murein DD-endopeptidase MepM/ murein hydrolase activator NlpD